MGDAGFWRMSATDLLKGYSERKFSPVEVTREVLDRADRIGKAKLSSILTLNTDDALEAAKVAEDVWMSSGDKPLLCGVPITVKDSIEVGGIPTTYASKVFLDNHKPDSELARRVRKAGGVIVGKSNLPEFSLGGAVYNIISPHGKNAWNLDHTCGGSSGGAGASVAAGIAPIAIGTDSGGSIRRPAAFNGVFGIKPTYQRIPAVQTWRAAPGRSHNGPLTRTVRDSALVLQALAGYDPRDPESNLPPVDDFLAYAKGDIRRMRVAVSYDFGKGYPMDEEILGSVKEAAQLFSRLGCEVIEADPPMLDGTETVGDGVWAFAGDHLAAVEAMIPNFLEKHLDDLSPAMKPIYESAPRASAWEVRLMVRKYRAYGQQMQQWFRDYDFLLSPSVNLPQRLDEVKPTNHSAPRISFTAPFNSTYNPAAAVPYGIHSSGLPMAVQIVGRLGDEVGVFRMAAAIESAHPWSHRWPKIAEGG